MFSIGSSISLYVSDPDLVKEISLNKSLNIGKTSFSNKSFSALFGKGIIQASGHAWAIQRKIIAPEFFMDKVKVCYIGNCGSTTKVILKIINRIS